MNDGQGIVDALNQLLKKSSRLQSSLSPMGQLETDRLRQYDTQQLARALDDVATLASTGAKLAYEQLYTSMATGNYRIRTLNVHEGAPSFLVETKHQTLLLETELDDRAPSFVIEDCLNLAKDAGVFSCFPAEDEGKSQTDMATRKAWGIRAAHFANAIRAAGLAAIAAGELSYECTVTGQSPQSNETHCPNDGLAPYP